MPAKVTGQADQGISNFANMVCSNSDKLGKPVVVIRCRIESDDHLSKKGNGMSECRCTST